MTTDLIEQARAGDGDAFRQLTDPHRRELNLHCYRMLGSVHDAEDAMQEIMLAAWQGLPGFEGRASMRTWLYRLATNRCLNARRSARRRPQAALSIPGVEPPEPTRLGEVVWLQPYPDSLLPDDEQGGPETRYERSEAISLAFVTALQRLPARQRAVLILRDVLGFHASEVAELLDTTVESVTSALKRARAALRVPSARPPVPDSATERTLVERMTRAYEAGDVDGLVALLTEDVVVSMPPVPLEYEGRALAHEFNTVITFREGRRYRLVHCRANGQPAFAAYVRDRDSHVLHAMGLIVVTLRDDAIAALTRFDNDVLPFFGLPRTLGD